MALSSEPQNSVREGVLIAKNVSFWAHVLCALYTFTGIGIETPRYSPRLNHNGKILRHKHGPLSLTPLQWGPLTPGNCLYIIKGD